MVFKLYIKTSLTATVIMLDRFVSKFKCLLTRVKLFYML
jgi:hypothetical protein